MVMGIERRWNSRPLKPAIVILKYGQITNLMSKLICSTENVELLRKKEDRIVAEHGFRVQYMNQNRIPNLAC